MPKHRKPYRLLITERLESRSLLAASQFGEMVHDDVLDQSRTERRPNAGRSQQERLAEVRMPLMERLPPKVNSLRQASTDQRDDTPQRKFNSPRPQDRKVDRQQHAEPRRQIAKRSTQIKPIVRLAIQDAVQRQLVNLLRPRHQHALSNEPPTASHDLVAEPISIRPNISLDQTTVLPELIGLTHAPQIEFRTLTLPWTDRPTIVENDIDHEPSKIVPIALDASASRSSDQTADVRMSQSTVAETDASLPKNEQDALATDRVLTSLRRRLNRLQQRLANDHVKPRHDLPFNLANRGNNPIFGPAPPTVSEQSTSRFVGPLFPGEITDKPPEAPFQQSNVAGEEFGKSLPAAIAAFVDNVVEDFDSANLNFAEPAAIDFVLMNLPDTFHSHPTVDPLHDLDVEVRVQEDAVIIDPTNGGLVELEPLGETPAATSSATEENSFAPSESSAAESSGTEPQTEMGDLEFNDTPLPIHSAVAEHPQSPEGGLVELPVSDTADVNPSPGTTTASLSHRAIDDLSMDAYLGVFQVMDVASDAGELGPSFQVQEIFDPPVTAGLNLRPHVAAVDSPAWLEAWVNSLIRNPRTLIPTIIVVASVAAIRSHLQFNSLVKKVWQHRKRATSNAN